MEKLNNNYDIENADTTCPVCKNDNKRYWLAFFLIRLIWFVGIVGIVMKFEK